MSWQIEVNQLIESEPDDFTIHWVIKSSDCDMYHFLGYINSYGWACWIPAFTGVNTLDFASQNKYKCYVLLAMENDWQIPWNAMEAVKSMQHCQIIVLAYKLPTFIGLSPKYCCHIVQCGVESVHTGLRADMVFQPTLTPLFSDPMSYVSLLEERCVCNCIDDLEYRRMLLYVGYFNEPYYHCDCTVFLLEEHKMLHPLALRAFNALWEDPHKGNRSPAYKQVSYFASNVSPYFDGLAAFLTELTGHGRRWLMSAAVTYLVDVSHLRNVKRLIYINRKP